jgi:hypothetical protein
MYDMRAAVERQLDKGRITEIDITRDVRELTEPGDKWKRFEPTDILHVCVTIERKA